MKENAQRGFPLRKWRLENFKSIRQLDLDLAPLTVLVGANSSGKSSVLQSVLLVSQSAQGDTDGDAFALNGPLASLGDYKDMRSIDASPGQPVVIGASLAIDSGTPSVIGLAELTGAAVSETLAARWSIAVDTPSFEQAGSASISRIELDVRGLQSDGPLIELRLDRRGQGAHPEDEERARLGRRVSPSKGDFALGFQGTLEIAGTPQTAVSGVMLRGGIPRALLLEGLFGAAAVREWVRARVEMPWALTSRPAAGGRRGVSAQLKKQLAGPELSAEARQELLESWAGVAAREIANWWLYEDSTLSLPAYLQRKRSTMQMEPGARMSLRLLAPELVALAQERLREHIDPSLPVLAPLDAWAAGTFDGLTDEVARFFKDRVVYLGPLRQDPDITYRSAPLIGAKGFIGSKGEYMAAVLHRFRNQMVDCPMPDGGESPMPLMEAVDFWVKTLDLADSVQTRDLGRLGIQVTVNRSSSVTGLDLTSVGVGVSQVLPVVVACLRTPKGSLILLEQPELHLHPAVQQKLGDFLLAMARCGRQLIVETHSEYLVSRLRRRIAEDPTPETMSHVRLVFAEQEEDVSRFSSVATDEYGAIQDWPKGFFDQAATEAREILASGLSKRIRAADSDGS